MPEYRYELRRGEQVVATGRLSTEEPLAIGEPLTLGRYSGIVRSVAPRLGERELHLIVQLRRDEQI